MADVPGLIYHGPVSQGQLVSAYQSSSLLVLPSEGDDFPLVSLEAQACGCIPVLPRTCAMAETVQEGLTGYIYEENTPEALANAVMSLWNDDLPTDDQRAKAAKWVSETFLWDQTGMSFLKAVDSAAQTSSIEWISLYYFQLRNRIRVRLRGCKCRFQCAR